MQEFLIKDVREIGADKKMACRFMGCKDSNLSEELEEIYEECLENYMDVAQPKAVVRKTSVTFGEDDEIIFDFGSVRSTSLKKNLESCREAYVFAATVGGEIDRVLKRLSVSSQVESMVLSCIASSGVECWCDCVNAEMAKEHKLRPRFSPGYGDVPLAVQPDILSYLDAGRKIGLTLTESLMMVPVKSVTAIVGIRCTEGATHRAADS